MKMVRGLRLSRFRTTTVFFLGCGKDSPDGVMNMVERPSYFGNERK